MLAAAQTSSLMDEPESWSGYDVWTRGTSGDSISGGGRFRDVPRIERHRVMSNWLLHVTDEQRAPVASTASFAPREAHVHQLINSLQTLSGAKTADEIAQRLRRVLQLRVEEAEADDEALVDPNALLAFVEFVSNAALPLAPEIGISGNGSLTAQWRSRGLSVSLHFLPGAAVNWVVHETGQLRGQFGTERAAILARRLARERIFA